MHVESEGCLHAQAGFWDINISHWESVLSTGRLHATKSSGFPWSLFLFGMHFPASLSAYVISVTCGQGL